MNPRTTLCPSSTSSTFSSSTYLASSLASRRRQTTLFLPLLWLLLLLFFLGLLALLLAFLGHGSLESLLEQRGVLVLHSQKYFFSQLFIQHLDVLLTQAYAKTLHSSFDCCEGGGSIADAQMNDAPRQAVRMDELVVERIGHRTEKGNLVRRKAHVFHMACACMPTTGACMRVRTHENVHGVCALACACMCGRGRLCVCVCMLVCVRACVRACLQPCAQARACMCACVVRVCARAGARTHVTLAPTRSVVYEATSRVVSTRFSAEELDGPGFGPPGGCLWAPYKAFFSFQERVHICS